VFNTAQQWLRTLSSLFETSPETKAGLHSLAQQRNLSDSTFLQKLVELRSFRTPV
jgi:hypothetical protein